MKREVKLGVFAVVVLVAAWAGARFLKGTEIFSNDCRYYAMYDQVGGIQAASHVMIHGVKVGSVTKVTLADDPSKGVELELSIDRRFRIPVDSKAKIFSNGVMGGKAVDIVMGSSAEYVENGGRLDSEVGVDILDMAGSELEFFKEKITVVVDGLTKTLNGINLLLSENVDGINSIVKNVDGVTGSMNDILKAEKVQLEDAIVSLSRFSKSLGDNAEKVDTIIGNLSGFSAQLAEADIAGEVAGAVGRLNDVLDAVNDESGSVGKLLNDAELYDNLAAASDNLSRLLADLKEHPKRYVHFSVFGNNPDRKAERAAERDAKRRAKAEKRGADNGAAASAASEAESER